MASPPKPGIPDSKSVQDTVEPTMLAALRSQIALLTQGIAEQRQLIVDIESQLKSLRTDILEDTARNSTNTAKQVECYFALRDFLLHGRLLPEMHGWPISPDFGMYLVQLVLSGAYDAILEFGSGTSTLLIAQASEQLAKTGRKKPKHIAFEHLDGYRQSTERALEHNCLKANVELILAPLAPYTHTDGAQYSYYPCQPALEALASDAASPKRLLLVVDGPPSATGPLSRFPAVPIVLETLRPASIDILLDDYSRSDEQRIASAWMNQLKHAFDKVTAKKLSFEKGAAFISATSDRTNLQSAEKKS